MNNSNQNDAMLNKTIGFFLENKLVVFLLVAFFLTWGAMVAPFDWDIPGLPRNPVPVDAIPDIGENQQIVFTKWMGRSPQDVDDQITYPLTVSLLGIPGVKTIRSNSFFGFSSIYIIFKEDVDFYWSRSRILEKLSSLPADTLPEGVKPSLGPDATALGQVFWYTLEGRDKEGKPTGGWDLDELRTQQDWYVRYALQAVEGVSEVASVGGFIKEYQIDVDPDAMRANKVTLDHVYHAIRNSNVDVGARTIEVNSAEYVIRGLGFIKNLKDVERTVVTVRNNSPVYVRDIAHVSFGPALRRGALDKGGAEAVGGVVVARYGENPLATIKRVKEQIKKITPGLPSKILNDGTHSQLSIVPFYDRSGLIYETLGTLNKALAEEILVTIIVILLTVLHFRSSFLISGLLPLSVLMCFIAMKQFGVDANVVALSGIAIAIGTMVDMGIVLSENILKHLKDKKPEESQTAVIFEATREVASAVMTAVATTVVSFLPVFAMEGAEGKLFKPLAFTKTFALIASLVVALFILPAIADILFRIKKPKLEKVQHRFIALGLLLGGILYTALYHVWIGALLILFSLYLGFKERLPVTIMNKIKEPLIAMAVLLVGFILTKNWLPLGNQKGFLPNLLFVALVTTLVLGSFYYFQKRYEGILVWALTNKKKFLLIPGIIFVFGGWVWANLGKEFMPPLDEGSYLYMPTTMPHASIGEALDVLQKLDLAMGSIPEVETAVGKLGRADTPLDPAPISMFEIVVNYKPEYKVDKNGKRLRFKYDRKKDDFVRSFKGELIPDRRGKPYRNWRKHIKHADDIWKELTKVAQMPGTTSAPKLQPIAARIIMLQSGMRAPMGLKIKGPDLKTIESFGLQIEQLLKEVPSIEADSVIADRIVGKPYLEIKIDRDAIARYGISIRKVQDIIEIAIGGRQVTTTVEGRERYPVRVRYQRELRDDIESLEDILVPASDGTQIPLIQLSEIQYVRGPQVIKSEDTFLTGYVLFDKKPQKAEVDVVEEASAFLNQQIKSGALTVPSGISFDFAGNYENQLRSEKKLRVVLPLALFIIFLILYFQFKAVSTTLIVFSGILLAWSGGFILIWLYGQNWFMNFGFFGVNLHNLFQMGPINLSVAVWVGFLALFGIASDDGVMMATYLKQSFEKSKPQSINEIQKAVVIGAKKRIRPCMMTTATTVLALVPVLTSSGRGSDIMLPMAIPSVGGMLVAVITTLLVPVLFSSIQERKLLK
ncbi:MAG TPA: efflux RND transporter permease subunit [Oligoflexia bacterium]|nr:efflux RND transporter permease subunit [bacterium]HMQ11363.1 efflux RND transporter permease subunit [Oligoflexia bacterium]HMR24071.1 efflux RND transporter permease subunit [Oligoflexia bacterium]